MNGTFLCRFGKISHPLFKPSNCNSTTITCQNDSSGHCKNEFLEKAPSKTCCKFRPFKFPALFLSSISWWEKRSVAKLWWIASKPSWYSKLFQFIPTFYWESCWPIIKWLLKRPSVVWDHLQEELLILQSTSIIACYGNKRDSGNQRGDLSQMALNCCECKFQAVNY